MGELWGYHHRGGESERGPPCGCAAYMWLCGIVCVVAGERESERERERGGGGGERERNNPSSKPPTSTARLQFTKVLKLHMLERKTIF
jgi:hypothetical protein